MDPSRSGSFEEAVVAALLVLPIGSVAAGLTAARLWRLDALAPVTLDEPLEFLVPGGLNSVRLMGCRLHFDAVTSVDLPLGVPATSLARTVIDVLATLALPDAVAVADAALRGWPELTGELAHERRRRLPRRGREHVGRVLDLASPLSESVLESHARVLWLQAGLPAPVQQARIVHQGAFLGRVDFLWPAARVIVEVDGLAKYAERGELQSEKARQNRLVAAGYTVLRFTWADIHGRPSHVVRQVFAAIARATA